MAYCYQKGLKLWKIVQLISKALLKMGGGTVGGCMLLILPPPVFAPGHKLQKQSKEPGIFQSLGTINFVLFTKRQNKGGGGGGMAQSHTDTFQTSQTHS